ncbi:MAG TPA: cation:proton antiporter [Terriglobia bacterium]|nr:cation:proton antiporter [Terriglobia bacterium]
MLNLVTLILQMTMVLVVCRLMGELFLKIRQPRVNGEMIAGVLLGPSLLGLLAPQISAYMFPKSSLEFLDALGQLGLVIYMFLAGLEIDPDELRKQAGAAASSSIACVAAPFLLAYPLALYLFPRVTAPGTNFLYFTLFLGVATSITAFPMLARIMAERGMLTSRLGVVSVAAAAGAGVIAWCILAYVVVMIKSARGGSTLLWTIVGIVAFGIVMFRVVKPLLRKYGAVFSRDGILGERAMVGMMILLLGAGVCTGYLGLHPLFGAFILGMAMPKDLPFVRYVRARLETMTLGVLLPLYFAFSGLRTNVLTVRGGQMWMWCGVIIAISILGKMVVPMLAARATGMPLRESAGLGALLNTRGLISLVVFNIGLDLKVISATLFSMLVMMALVNTLLTTWLLDLFYPVKLSQTNQTGEALGQPAIEAVGA